MLRMYLVLSIALICAFALASPIKAIVIVDDYYVFLYRQGHAVVGLTIYLDAYLYDSEWNPVEGARIGFEVISGPNAGIFGFDDTDENGHAEFSYVGSGGLGDDEIVAYYDIDDDWYFSEGEPNYSDYIYWVFGDVYLSYHGQPFVGSPIYLDAWFYESPGVPVEGAIINFEVVSGPNAGVYGSDDTDENGHAEFSYVGSGGSVEDEIMAYYDANGNGWWDPGEPCSVISVYWNWPLSLTLSPSKGSPPVGNTITIQAQVQGLLAPGNAQSTNSGQQYFDIKFEIETGPNAGLTQIVKTDDKGIATFSYTGNSLGIDGFVVSFAEYPNWQKQYGYMMWMRPLIFVAYQIVSSKRDGRYFTTEMYVDIKNPSSKSDFPWPPDYYYKGYYSAYNVTATISKAPSWVQVIDGDIDFIAAWEIEPGETQRNWYNTFKIRTDTKSVKDPKEGINWTIYYYDWVGNRWAIENVPQLTK